MVPKVEGAWDIHYVDRLLAQLEAQGRRRSGRSSSTRSSRPRSGVANVEEIAYASPRMQGMSFGPADLAASRRMKTTRVGGGHPGYRVDRATPTPTTPRPPRVTAQQDPWHYSIARMVDACTERRDPAVLRPVRRHQGRRRLRGAVPRRVPARLRRRLVAAPGQIDIAKKVFSPDPDEVAVRQEGHRGDPRRPRRAHDRRQDAGRRDLEAVQGDGRARRDARARRTRSWRRPTGSRPRRRLVGIPLEFRPQHARPGTGRMRFFEYEAREIVERAGIPVTDYGFSHDAPTRRATIAERIGGPDGDQVAGAHRRPDEGRRRQVRRHARGGRGARRATILELEINGHMPRGVLVDPKAEVEQEYYAGVVWDGTAQAAGDALLRHGRHRHRGGRRGAPRPRRPRPLLEPAAVQPTSRPRRSSPRPA